MSAFLMSEESVSDLAYNIFRLGKGNDAVVEYFSKYDITCPEDLFNKLRWDNMRSMNVRYGEKYTKKNLGDYHFRKTELTIPEMVKKIHCWKYQSCESEKVENGPLWKMLTKFEQDCASKFLRDSREYTEATWG